MTIAQQLAFRTAAANWEDVPVHAQHAMKLLILDTLGCAIGAIGSSGPVAGVRRMVDELGGSPVATMIGGGRTAPDRAALYNGALIRYLDFNDTFLAAREGCHPSDNLAPVLAASEHAGQDGPGFLTALAVAYGVQCGLTEHAPVRHRGFDHTTQGIYGVAAGVSRALGLDPTSTANALCIAGTAFNSLRVTRTGELSNWKGLAYPMASAAGTHAAYLARHGITGPASVFEGVKGFMDVIAGPFETDWIAQCFDYLPHVLVKRYNAEAHSQSAIEGLLVMKEEHGFVAGDVVAIDAHVFDACWNIIGGGEEGAKHRVATKEAADHSLPYLLSVALLDGTVMPEQYAPERITSDDVVNLMGRVRVREDPALTARFPAQMPIRLEVALSDGRTLVHEQVDFEGYPTRPMSWERVQQKFRSLTHTHASPALTQEIIDTVSALDRLSDITSLTTLLSEIPMAEAGGIR